MEDFNSRDCDKALVRLPPGMRDELKGLAKAGYRSMNAEIVARLRRDIDREKMAFADAKAASAHTA